MINIAGLGKSYKRLDDYEKAADYSERAISILEGLDNVYRGFKQCGDIGNWADTMVLVSEISAAEKDFMSAIQIMKNIRLETRNSLAEKGIVL